jgi:hypothetical protein
MKGEVSKLNPAFGKQTYRYVAYGIIELDWKLWNLFSKKRNRLVFIIEYGYVKMVHLFDI